MSGFSFCLILLLPICTRAQDLPECAIPHTTAAITIDGGDRASVVADGRGYTVVMVPVTQVFGWLGAHRNISRDRFAYRIGL